MRRNLERIYRQHKQGLYTLALTITRCPARAEDAVHEAFTRLWQSKLPQADDILPYVFAAVRNAAIDQVRKRPAASDLPVSIFNGSQTGPETEAINAEQQEILGEALETLPDAQREAIVMKIYAGLTFEQIASATGEPLQTIAARYRRGLERLRERMRVL